jgi:hypothetical protein
VTLAAIPSRYVAFQGITKVQSPGFNAGRVLS